MIFINIIKSKTKIKSSTTRPIFYFREKGHMKKLIFTIILCLFTAIAFAEERDRLENLPGVWWEKVPAVCVENSTLYDYAERNELQALNRSFGRTGGKPDCEIVYVVTYWVNVENNQVMSSVMVPNAEYSCVLYRTFDLQVNPDFEFEIGIST